MTLEAYSVLLKNYILINFVFLLSQSLFSNLITIFLYIFVFQLKEVLVKLEASTNYECINLQLRLKKLKICVFTTYIIISSMLEVCKIMLYEQYSYNKPVEGWKKDVVHAVLAFKIIQTMISLGVAVLFFRWLKEIMRRKEHAEKKRQIMQTQVKSFKCIWAAILILWLFHIE